MVLALTSRTVSVAFGVVSFFMTDEKRTIRVDVSQDLLARLEGPPPPVSKAGYVEVLTRHRRRFAEIAAAKYDEGQYEPEVNVLVVLIAANDFLE
jgi:hypothetical protein